MPYLIRASSTCSRTRPVRAQGATHRVSPTRAAVLGMRRRIMGQPPSTGREAANVAVA